MSHDLPAAEVVRHSRRCELLLALCLAFKSVAGVSSGDLQTVLDVLLPLHIGDVVVPVEGNLPPELRTAARTRSWLSRTAASGRPTTTMPGMPWPTSTSTSTSTLFPA